MKGWLERLLRPAGVRTDGGGMDYKYPQNPIEGFANGACLDLRARLAVDILKAPLMQEALKAVLHHAAEGKVAPEKVPGWVANFALDVATDLMRQAEERGYVQPLPDSAELSAALKKQAARNGKFNFEQQQAFNREVQAAQSGVVPVAGVLKPN